MRYIILNNKERELLENINKTTCIIPFWNEGQRLYNVLDEVVKTKNIAEIICVDDASEIDNSLEIHQKYPRVKLIRLDRNVGKTDAIREGLKYAQNKLILLLDADLRNLNHKEIEAANDAIQQNLEVDMVILRRINAVFLVRMDRRDILFTGERILKKRDLEEILRGSVKGWQLESAINTWMYDRKKEVYWVPQSGINTHKQVKWGFFIGIKNDIKTFSDMVLATGLINYLKQILFFARNQFKKTEIKTHKSLQIKPKPVSSFKSVTIRVENKISTKLCL
ncbi:MAG: glycosyltransferase [Bacteroidales bacterium]|nr:glycosyltransferase [Bacteroidales bacterium]